jgi:hypothetical protein
MKVTSNTVAMMTVALAALGGVSASHAGSAWEFTSIGTERNLGSFDFADAFTVNSTVEATGLGYFASPVNGQVDSNPVVLYQCSDIACDGTATILASVTVTNTYAIVGHFRYVTIPTVTLSPGVGYEVAGVSFSDDYAFDDPGFATDPAINYPLNETRWSNISTPDFLNSVNTAEIVSDGFHGPNVFLGAPTFVPEPGGGGAGGPAARVRRWNTMARPQAL